MHINLSKESIIIFIERLNDPFALAILLLSFQDRMGFFWTLERVNRRLERMMHEAFVNVYKAAAKYDVSLRIGAYILAIDKVAKSLKIRGIYA